MLPGIIWYSAWWSRLSRWRFAVLPRVDWDFSRAMWGHRDLPRSEIGWVCSALFAPLYSSFCQHPVAATGLHTKMNSIIKSNSSSIQITLDSNRKGSKSFSVNRVTAMAVAAITTACAAVCIQGRRNLQRNDGCIINNTITPATIAYPRFRQKRQPEFQRQQINSNGGSRNNNSKCSGLYSSRPCNLQRNDGCIIYNTI